MLVSPLCKEGLLEESGISTLLAGRPRAREQVHYGSAYAVQRGAIDRAYERFRENRAAFPELDKQLSGFRRAHGQWLEQDALYPVLFRMHGRKSRRTWISTTGEPHPDRDLFNPAPGSEAACADRRAELLKSYKGTVERYTFGQLLMHRQHQQLLTRCRNLGARCTPTFKSGCRIRTYGLTRNCRCPFGWQTRGQIL
jgi:4-alpha-glucanotransferase